MKKVIRALSVGIVLVAMVAILATASTAASSKPDYDAELLYDWDALFLEGNNVAELGWWGFDAAVPSADTMGTISIWRFGPDANGNKTYSYNPDNHAVTIKWNGKNWQALQVQMAQDETAPLLTAKNAFISFQVYFPDDGSFPGLELHKEDNFAKISPEGLFYTYKKYDSAMRAPTNMVQVGQLQPGWNWITIIGMQETDSEGTPNDFRLYFSMLDPHDGITGEQLESMPSINVGKATTLGNLQKTMKGGVNQFMFDVQRKGTIDNPTEVTFKGLCLGLLNRKADAFMQKVREMDAVSIDDDAAGKYALYLEAKELLVDPSLYFTDSEYTIYTAFEAYIQSLVDNVAAAAESAIEDAEEEEKLADKYEIFCEVLALYADLYAMSETDFPLPEDFQDALDDYNKDVSRANAALIDALMMTAGIANGYYSSNTDIPALLGDMKNKILPKEEDEE